MFGYTVLYSVLSSVAQSIHSHSQYQYISYEVPVSKEPLLNENIGAKMATMPKTKTNTRIIKNKKKTKSNLIGKNRSRLLKHVLCCVVFGMGSRKYNNIKINNKNNK